MAVPPSSTNVFQMLKDVFNKANGYEILNTDVKTKTLEGAEFKTFGSSNMDTNRVTGFLENKYEFPQQVNMAVHPSCTNFFPMMKDICNKAKGNGMMNTDVKTKTSEGAEFKTSGSSNMDTNRVTGTQENKYELPQQVTMAVPPSFADLGKSAKDIFNKGYGYGMMNLDVKTKSSEGAEFKTSGSMNMDTNRVTGTQENQYKWPQHGLTFTEKWTTENTFGAGVCVEDKIAKGLKLSFDTMFSPNTGKTSNLLKTAYKREYLNAGLDVDLDFAGPTLHGAAVGGYKGWLGGCQMTYDSAKSKMTQGNISLGYKTEYTQIHTNIEDGKGFFGSIYQKVNDKLETAMNMGWRHDSNTTSFGIAAKYQLDSSAFISAKVNNSGLLGLGYTQSLRPGIKLTLSALLDGKNINAGGHKLGLGLEMET
ncbi:voltage-dependent anion-selective channel protein 2-like isoform X44 [Gouania willdenowi]|uniref:voltage-dependent anion-selective channel protein 2-like isoform X44 n=1 Tax=Gouania willdenowi TaxID=441366 RepID=UPI0010552518|nr:voltage-dependent anion-selective channel protein 2-like isoform X44 [Gouania willdenowi]